MQGDAVLSAESVVKHFLGQAQGLLGARRAPIQAVAGVDLDVWPGETLALVGESGCGKSTMARLLVGLERPTSGRVLYRGVDIAGISRLERKRFSGRVQMVFQDPYTSLNARMTIEDIVAEGWKIHRELAPKAGLRAGVKELLERVGIRPELIDRFPHQFSGGQRQRIGIARALALSPEVLILDEPVSALDVSVQAQVLNLLADLQRDLSIAFVLVSHDLSVVRLLSQRVAVMYLGRIVELGSAAQVYEQPGHPYTSALLSAVPSHVAGERSLHERIVLRGDVPSPSNPPEGCRFHTRCWKAEDVCSSVDPTLLPIRSATHCAACHLTDRSGS